MKILFCVSEAVPFVKTGGLADVAGALPEVLRALGHDIRLLLPRYQAISAAGLAKLADLQVPLTSTRGRTRERTVVQGSILEGRSPDGGTIYLVDCPHFYDRAGLYGEEGRDYPDNLARFVFFSRAALTVADHLFAPDLFHCNDWHTGLVPAYLNERRRQREASWPSLFTVHNIAHQGLFPAEQFSLTGLPSDYFIPQGLEFWQQVNCLKAGLVYANLINTVSETYAREIQTREYGAGLEGVLAERRRDLFGVLNGVDYARWDPRVDTHLPARYGPDDMEGKKACKRALQQERGLEVLPYAPLVGMVSRLTDQKGGDLVADILPRLIDRGAQFVLLGLGDLRYHTLFTELSRRFPRQVSVELGFDEGLAHRIEAGADMFLMPSRFEPSGLNQLYSMRYGTVPIVRRTGGLADSVTDVTPETVSDGTATGFVFTQYKADALWDAVERALSTFRDTPLWRQIQRHAMQADFSWNRSARHYVALYERTLGRTVEAGRAAVEVAE